MLIFCAFVIKLLKKIFLQRKYYVLSVEKSKSTKKPLLIIGCPNAGIINKIIKTYSHGDICLDIDGCEKCLKYDINSKELVNFGDNQFVIFESATFSFSKNIIGLLKEINRTSGGDFYSSGSDLSLFFRSIGRRIYEKFNRDEIRVQMYPFQPSDEYIKYYDISSSKMNKIKFNPKNMGCKPDQ
jgi:hypothetical protein